MAQGAGIPPNLPSIEELNAKYGPPGPIHILRMYADMNDGLIDPRIGWSLLTLLLDKRFDDVDFIFNEWNNPKQRFPDGTWRASYFTSHVYSMLIAQQGEREFEMIQEWRQRNPTSVGAAIAEASYWIRRALAVRGNGPEKSIRGVTREIVEEHLAKAERVLISSKGYAAASPLWYEEYLNVARGLGWSRAEKMALFNAGISRHGDYPGIYLQMAMSLLPDWGGDYELVDNFILDAAKKTAATDGDSMYTTLYWSLLTEGGCECDFFRDSLLSWTTMKKGFEDLMQRFPGSKWNLNGYASLACGANDKSTYMRLRARIGKDLDPRAWLHNQGADVCDRRFLDQT